MYDLDKVEMQTHGGGIINEYHSAPLRSNHSFGEMRSTAFQQCSLHLPGVSPHDQAASLVLMIQLMTSKSSVDHSQVGDLFSSFVDAFWQLNTDNANV